MSEDEPPDWHQTVTYITGEDLREPPLRNSQASDTVRQQRQVRQRRNRNRRATRQMRRK